MKPPFAISSTMLAEISRIERLIGQIESLDAPRPQPQLRRANRIRTIQGSLAIEGNTLSFEQVTAVIEGKPVLGKPSEIQEVKNAVAAYEGTFHPRRVKDLLKAHRVLMKGLIPSAGHWRSGNVGVLKGSKVSQIAPKPDLVPGQMDNLFTFLKSSDDHPLIQGCVFHYELEFIHPFEDGNGRIGRFWHSRLLMDYHPVFEFIPVESLIKAHQADYYRVLETCDRSGDSSRFVEFALHMIHQALVAFIEQLRPEPVTAETRLTKARSHFGAETFSRKDYLALFKTISNATASRDLRQGVDAGQLTKSGDKATTRYQFES